MPEEKKVFHIEIDLTQEELDEFMKENSKLMQDLCKMKHPTLDRLNTIWKVHNQITMAKHAIKKEGI